jgi:hypothetical protein
MATFLGCSFTNLITLVDQPLYIVTCTLNHAWIPDPQFDSYHEENTKPKKIVVGSQNSKEN